MAAATAALISTGGWAGWACGARPLSATWAAGAGAVACTGVGGAAAATAGAVAWAVAAAGWGAGASTAASPPSSITRISVPTGTVAPSSTFNSLMTPAAGEGISAFTLSVMTSASDSYFSILSPGCFSHLPIVPSVTLSPSWGMVTCVNAILLLTS